MKPDLQQALLLRLETLEFIASQLAAELVRFRKLMQAEEDGRKLPTKPQLRRSCVGERDTPRKQKGEAAR